MPSSRGLWRAPASERSTVRTSLAGLRELLQQASGQPEPTVQGVVQSLLKFQGIKVSESGPGAAHAHGALSVDMADLDECTARVKSTVSACLKRVGIEEAGPGADASAGSPPPQRASTLSRLGSKLSSTVSSSSGGAKAWEGDGADGGMAIQFGGGDGGGSGGGGGLYLASS